VSTQHRPTDSDLTGELVVGPDEYSETIIRYYLNGLCLNNRSTSRFVGQPPDFLGSIYCCGAACVSQRSA
jgi:hypothetical protein